MSPEASLPPSGPTDAEVCAAVQACWSADTAWHPSDWSIDNPAAGQCWPSAFVLRALLGGRIDAAQLAPPRSPPRHHAWNVLPDGRTVDLTRCQFPVGQRFDPCTMDEEQVYRAVGRQSERLLDRVCAYLAIARPAMPRPAPGRRAAR